MDDRVVSRAKHYAKLRGVSVSKMVEAYLTVISEPPAQTPGSAPVLRSVRGVLKNADLGDYRKHRAAKYK